MAVKKTKQKNRKAKYSPTGKRSKGGKFCTNLKHSDKNMKLCNSPFKSITCLKRKKYYIYSNAYLCKQCPSKLEQAFFPKEIFPQQKWREG